MSNNLCHCDKETLLQKTIGKMDFENLNQHTQSVTSA